MAVQVYVWTCSAGRGTQLGSGGIGTTQKEVPNCNQGIGTYQLVEVASLSQPYQPDIETMVFASAGTVTIFALGLGFGWLINIVKKART